MGSVHAHCRRFKKTARFFVRSHIELDLYSTGLVSCVCVPNRCSIIGLPRKRILSIALVRRVNNLFDGSIHTHMTTDIAYHEASIAAAPVPATAPRHVLARGAVVHIFPAMVKQQCPAVGCNHVGEIRELVG